MSDLPKNFDDWKTASPYDGEQPSSEVIQVDFQDLFDHESQADFVSDLKEQLAAEEVLEFRVVQLDNKKPNCLHIEVVYWPERE